MPASQLYPRSTVKRIIRAHSNKSLSINADITIFLNYTLFMQEFMREVSIKSRQSGEKTISARTIKRIRENVLRKFKG